MNKTPIDSFIDYKDRTGMQCGNYHIEVPKLKDGEQYRFHFDATSCIGCHCCEVACNELQNNPPDVKWRRVAHIEGGEFPDVLQLFNSMGCNHCIEPECLKGCPTNSYIKLDNGVVYHVDESCIGCQYCTWNCPYEVPRFNSDRGIVTKCDMCVDKLNVGETPACVQTCPAGAISIEAVNKQEWIKNDIYKQGIAPLLPDVKITKPTTRYTLPKNIPDNLRPEDERILKPAHSELPLVFMTLLTQISLGAFGGVFIADCLNFLGFSLAKVDTMVLFLAFLPLAIGLPLSALHLGRPSLAISAIKNYKTSWLSREALALGIFGAFMSIVALLYYLQAQRVLILLVETITLAIGVYGIYAQSMIYRVKARVSWDRDATTKTFLSSSYVGVLLMGFIFLLNNRVDLAITLLTVSLLISLRLVFVIYSEFRFYKYLKRDDRDFYELNRVKKLYARFKSIGKFRLYTLMFCAIFMPIIAILLLVNQYQMLALILIGLATIVAFASELSGRYLFYVTVVPKGLSGSFFAGNQRG